MSESSLDKPITGIKDYDRFKLLVEKKYGHKIIRTTHGTDGYPALVLDNEDEVKVLDDRTFKANKTSFGGRFSAYTYSEFGYKAKEKEKEPWQMTNAEFTDSWELPPPEWWTKFGWSEGWNYNNNRDYRKGTGHHGVVLLALQKGLPVPYHVLKEYPDLSPEAQAKKKADFLAAFQEGIDRDDRDPITGKKRAEQYIFEAPGSSLGRGKKRSKKELDKAVGTWMGEIKSEHDAKSKKTVVSSLSPYLEYRPDTLLGVGFKKHADKSSLFGRHYTDWRGKTYEIVDQNDLHVAYAREVGKNGKVKGPLLVADHSVVDDMLDKARGEKEKEDSPNLVLDLGGREGLVSIPNPDSKAGQTIEDAAIVENIGGLQGLRATGKVFHKGRIIKKPKSRKERPSTTLGGTRS